MRRLAIFAALTLAAGPAAAHHPLAGAPMETFAHGLLSGFGHPILGFDHLFFLLALGALAALTGPLWRAPLAFLAASGVGVASGWAAPEALVALSLVAIGGAAAFGLKGRSGLRDLALAAAGLVHGAAYGAAMAGVEASAAAPVLSGYLVGLIVVQWALVVGFGLAIRRIAAATPMAAPARLAGAMTAGVGVFLLLEAGEAALLLG